MLQHFACLASGSRGWTCRPHHQRRGRPAGAPASASTSRFR